MKKIKLNTWNRKEHFEFFKKFDEPFFGIISEVDCSPAYQLAKENKWSFFAYYLHKSLMAVNEIEEFRYRIQDGEVIVHDEVHSGSTIGRKDGTFAFSFVKYNADFLIFQADLKKEIENVNNSTGLRLECDDYGDNIIHYSSLPWIKYTAITHPRMYHTDESIPKITFGKASLEDERRVMPVSVYAHHALMDGYHVGRYFELFQKLMNE